MLSLNTIISPCGQIVELLRLNDWTKMKSSVYFCEHEAEQTWPRGLRFKSHTAEQNGSLKVSLQDVRMSQNSTKSLSMKFWVCIRSSSEGKYCMLSSCMRGLSSCSTRKCRGGVVEPWGFGLSRRAPLAFSRTPRYESMSVSSRSLSELQPLSLPTESERMCSIWYFSCIRNWFVFLGARIPLATFPLTFTGRRESTGLWMCRDWWWRCGCGWWWLRPFCHPPPPPPPLVLRTCRRPLQLLDQPGFLRLATSLSRASFPSCSCCCCGWCWCKLLLHIFSESIFLSFFQLRPFSSAALLHILLSTTTKREREREAGLCFIFCLRSQMTSVSFKVYLFTIISSFFLPFGFGWRIARSSSTCSSSLTARLAPLGTPSSWSV